MSHALNEFDVRNAAESQAFCQVARTANLLRLELWEGGQRGRAEAML